MLKHHHGTWENSFDADHVNFWSQLSRFNNLLIILNVSMFFLTGLVAKGYFFTFYSLICLGVVGMGVLLPTALIHRLWYYWIFFSIELLGLYFLVASMIYWVNHSAA